MIQNEKICFDIRTIQAKLNRKLLNRSHCHIYFLIFFFTSRTILKTQCFWKSMCLNLKSVFKITSMSYVSKYQTYKTNNSIYGCCKEDNEHLVVGWIQHISPSVRRWTLNAPVGGGLKKIHHMMTLWTWAETQLQGNVLCDVLAI